MNRLDLAGTFITIADTGSIRQAANSLHQTKAAISKKLAKLESHLKTRLANRERKGLVLTEAGQRYYHEAKKAMAQFALADQAVQQMSDEPQGKLRVVANQHYAQNVILPKLSGFLEHYPKIKVSLDISEILPDFNTKKMDILFGVSANGGDNLVKTKIDETRYVLCASPHYIKQKGMPNSGAELLQHDFIAHCARQSCDTIILDHCEQLIMQPKLFLNNTQSMIQAALQHLGIIWTHEDRVIDLLNKKKLIRILDQHMQQPINVYAYYEYQPFCDPKIRAFMEFFVKINKIL